MCVGEKGGRVLLLFLQAVQVSGTVEMVFVRVCDRLKALMASRVVQLV